jgi:hypothetical protein
MVVWMANQMWVSTYQALFFEDVELRDSKATLRQFRVPAKATIYIERRQLSIDDYDILDGQHQIEEGFKGTPLVLFSLRFSLLTQCGGFHRHHLLARKGGHIKRRGGRGRGIAQA